MSPKTSPITGLPVEDYRIPKTPLWKRLNWKRILPLLAAVLLLGRYVLNESGLTREGEVLEVIDLTAQAIEEKNRGLLDSVLSEEYSDRTGLDKRGLLDLAQLYFNSRDKIEVIRMGSEFDFSDEDHVVAKIRYQVIGSIHGALYRGFRDGSALGEKVIYHLRVEEGEWKITAIDPEHGTWR